MRIDLPLRVRLSIAGDKWFILNLNNYRNAHYQTLSKAKRYYGVIVVESLPKGTGKLVGPVHLHYRYYAASARRVDVSNPCSIIDKFCCDALTDAGVWDDDDVKTVVSVTYEYAGIDRANPRCELEIKAPGL
jgi:hypothetical protein